MVAKLTRIALIVVLAATLGLLWNSLSGRGIALEKNVFVRAEDELVDAPTAKQRLERGALFLDARPIEFYRMAHIPVFAGADGTCTITATNDGFSATANGTVTTFAATGLAFINIPGSTNNVDVNGHFAYVAAGSAGLQVVDVSNPKAPVSLARWTRPGLPTMSLWWAAPPLWLMGRRACRSSISLTPTSRPYGAPLIRLAMPKT